MSAPFIGRITENDALEEIDALLKGVGLPEDELNELGEEYLLSEREYGAWRRIVELRWLLKGIN